MNLKEFMAALIETLGGLPMKLPKYDYVPIALYHRKGRIQVRAFRADYINRSKVYKPNGAKECARRRRQIAAGQLTIS